MPDELHCGGRRVASRSAAGSIKACSRAASRCSDSGSVRSSRRSYCTSCRHGAGCSGSLRSLDSSSACCCSSSCGSRRTRRAGKLIGATQRQRRMDRRAQEPNIVRLHARAASARCLACSCLSAMVPEYLVGTCSSRRGRWASSRRPSASAGSSASSACRGLSDRVRPQAAWRFWVSSARRSSFGCSRTRARIPSPCSSALFVVLVLLSRQRRVDHGSDCNRVRAARPDLRGDRDSRRRRARSSAAASRRLSRVTSRIRSASSVLNVALIGVALGIIVTLFLRETAPRKSAAVAVPERI